MPDTDGGARPDPLTAEHVRSLYTELRGIHTGRNAGYADARRRYIGDHWDDAGGVNPMPEGKRYTLVANYVRPTVDKAVQLLFGQMPGIQVMPPGTDEMARRTAEAEEALLYGVWDVNKAPMVFRRAAHNMVLLRRGWLYYWWDAGAEKVCFRSVAPDNVFPIYDGEVLHEMVMVSRRLTRELQRAYPKQADMIRPDEMGDEVFDEARWTRMVAGQVDTMQEGTGTMDRRERVIGGYTTVIDWYDRFGNWTRVMGENASHTQNLGYGTGRVPFVELVNNLPGDEREPRSEVDDIVELNLYLDGLLSQTADVIKKWSNPTVVTKKAGQQPKEVARILQGEGGVLPIHENGDVFYLNWQGLAPDIQQQWDRVMNAIRDLTGKPESSYGHLMSNQSGVATNMALSPATATTEEKQSIVGFCLSELNEDILRLYEKFMKGKEIRIRGSRQEKNRPVFYETTIDGAPMRGSDINGWVKNRIKWPSALRTDDPVYVQNELQKMQAQPPAQSVYTTLENLGMEDVEAEIDRIKEQLMDPRFNPEGMQTSIAAAQALQESMLPEPLGGLDPAVQASQLEGGDPAMREAAIQSGSPHADQLGTGY